MTPDALALLLQPIRAVRRRMRLQAAAEGAARLLVAAAIIPPGAVLMWKLGKLHRPGAYAAAGSCAALLLVGALVGALRRIALLSVAKRVDKSHALADRIGSALEFAAASERSAFMEAAILDGANAAAQVVASRAAPFRRPPHLAFGALSATLAGLLLLVRLPSPVAPSLVTTPSLPRMEVDRDLLELERDHARELLALAEATHDEDLKQTAEELNRLLHQLDRRELTRKEAFDKLAELEKRVLLGSHGDAASWDEAKRQLRKAGEELSRAALGRDVGAALKEEDLAQAKRALAALAKQVAEAKGDEKHQRELSRALDQAAHEPPPSSEEQKALDETRKLEAEQRRLKKEQEKEPKNEETARRLERNERRLDELKRQQEKRQEAERQLQRLRRDMQSAANQMRDQNRAGASQSMQSAADQLGKMQDEIRKLGSARLSHGAVAQLKELLQRSGGQSRDQPGEGGQRGKGGQGGKAGEEPGQDGEAVALAPYSQGGQDGNSQSGSNGQHGKGNGSNSQRPKPEKLGDFLARAKGGPGEHSGAGPRILRPDANGNTILLDENGQPLALPGEGGDAMMPMGMGGPGDKTGMGGTGQPNGGAGDGIGDSHDPNLQGASTRLSSRRQAIRAEAKLGAGPSKSETILGSSSRGFASAGYRRVYGDYTSVVEEVMSKEQVPPGYRFYVKRYFQLIKPRE